MVRVANAAASPLRYEMDPQGQYNALKAIEDGGGELLAIYHSHTKSAAYPSQTDVNQAVAWPEPGLPDHLAGRPGRPRRQGVPAQGPEDRRCPSSMSHSPDLERPGAGGGGGGTAAVTTRAGAGAGAAVPWSRSPSTRNQMEAEMIQGLLADAGVPSVVQRSVDNPEFLASGPRDVKVVSDLAGKARAVLAETMVEEGRDPEWAELEEQARVRGSGETSPGRLALWILTAFLGALILAWILYQLS